MRKGFTLIELLIVFSILGILTVLGVSSFRTARLKARDVTRKSDLFTISQSLEAFVNDHREYPTSNNGLIVCRPPSTCNWGEPFVDVNQTLYAAKLPKDPTANTTYVYESNGTTYTLYARLENPQDPDINLNITTLCGAVVCNYQKKSHNQL